MLNIFRILLWAIVIAAFIGNMIHAETNYVSGSKYSVEGLSATYFEEQGIIRITGRFLNHSDYAVKGRLLILLHNEKQEVSGSTEVRLNRHNFIKPGKYTDFETYVRIPDGVKIKRVSLEFIKDESAMAAQ